MVDIKFRLPGTQHIQSRSGGTFWCTEHHCLVRPYQIAIWPEPPEQCCMMCLWEEIGDGSFTDAKLKDKSVSLEPIAFCQDEACFSQNLEGLCIDCRGRFCSKHINHETLLCEECTKERNNPHEDDTRTPVVLVKEIFGDIIESEE